MFEPDVVTAGKLIPTHMLVHTLALTHILYCQEDENVPNLAEITAATNDHQGYRKECKAQMINYNNPLSLSPTTGARLQLHHYKIQGD